MNTLDIHHICMFTWTLRWNVHLQSRRWGCWEGLKRGAVVTLSVISSVQRSEALSVEIWPFTNCSSPTYWNKGVRFHTGAVLEWACHMLILSFPLVSYYSMQFSDAHAGHLETGLRLRNPDTLYPIFISDQTPLPCFISEDVPLLGPPFCILYIL